MRSFTHLLLLLLLVPLMAWGQDRLQSPAEFLGYEIGTRFSRHHQAVDYYEHVAAVKSNVQLMSYGETNEGRPLVVAVVSSPANMARLEEIRTNNLKITGHLDGSPTDLQPALVWLSYNVHGNESVSMEAALLTLHELADPTNARTQAWLENTVVFLDPCINPDGRDRYANWYNQMVGMQMNINPDAREHREPWPGGRTNHYYFDLNRDWAWLTQVESQGRMALYQQWLPHVHVDFHEQGANSPYYFAPAARPYHEDITPWQVEFQMMIGQNHARYFDDEGWLYFTREVFDLFYPSYGDTYPTFHGAIGMTYEQGGGGFAGLGVEIATGDTLTLGDRVAHHHTNGLSTIEVTSVNQPRVVQEFSDYFNRARTNPPGDYKTYVIKGTNEADKLHDFLRLMDAQHIQYGHNANVRRPVSGFSYRAGETESVQIEPNDILISAYQPNSVFVKVLLEPNSVLEDSLTYDITAWSLPYAYDLDAYALNEQVSVEQMSRTAPARPNNTFSGNPYAYLAEWKSINDLRFLADLLEADVRVRYATRPFDIEGQSWDRGTLIILRGDNPDMGARFHEVVVAAANAHGEQLTPTQTGFVTSGQDFGSNGVRYIRAPKVAMLAGDAVSSGAYGETWHFFDQQIGYPVTSINAGNFGGVNLDNYDVLILPNGFYGNVLNEANLKKVTDWVRGGGRLIAMEGAMRFLVGKQGFAVKRKSSDDEEGGDKANPEQKKYGDRIRDSLTESVPGSIYQVTLDHTHPLGFGYPAHYFYLKRGGSAYAYLENGWNVGVIEEGAHRAGFTGSDAAKRLDYSMVIGVQNMGGGEVVYMADSPLFRAFWQNGKLLFGNAVFIVGN